MSPSETASCCHPHLPCLAIDWDSDGENMGLGRDYRPSYVFSRVVANAFSRTPLSHEVSLHTYLKEAQKTSYPSLSSQYHFHMVISNHVCQNERLHLNLEGKQSAMTGEMCRASHSGRSLTLVPNFPFLVSPWGDQLYILLSTL